MNTNNWRKGMDAYSKTLFGEFRTAVWDYFCSSVSIVLMMSTQVQAPVLVDFWQENFKVQVEARTGAVLIHPTGTLCWSCVAPCLNTLLASDEPPSKRRKIRNPNTLKEIFTDSAEQPYNDDFGMDIDMAVDIGRDGMSFRTDSKLRCIYLP